VTALREEMFRVGLLEISASYFVAWYLRRDGEDRNAAAVAVVESVDQMQIPWAAASGTNSQLSSEMGFSAGGKGCRFFMPEMNPIQFLGCANRIGNAVE
jgi:hypothetical protein